MSGTLELKEAHPAAQKALRFVLSHSPAELAMFQESFSSCAIAGNRLAQVCSETLRRVMHQEPVSDRYILGLAWTMMDDIETVKKATKLRGKMKEKGFRW